MPVSTEHFRSMGFGVTEHVTRFVRLTLPYEPRCCCSLRRSGGHPLRSEVESVIEPYGFT